MRVGLFSCLALAAATAIAAHAQTSIPAEVWRSALHPKGMPERVNELTGKKERAEFIYAAGAVLPDSNRHVVVYAERLSEDLPFDKLYTVHVAVAAQDGEKLTLLDRRDVTRDIDLYTDLEGNFMDLRASVTPLPAKPQMVAIALWTQLHGSGAISAGQHQFYTLSSGGKLMKALDLETYAYGRSGPLRSAHVSTLAFSDPDLVVTSRDITWEDAGEDAPPDCAPVSVTRYRFNGTAFVATDDEEPLPPGAVVLPRLDVEQSDDVCNDSSS
ncbi:MAG TPA: hypothetical protein VEK11_21820 [Thermoanaerobaculia bacterium]|nr:hypothetical protein [Thermoanaerobaculia bacterium]